MPIGHYITIKTINVADNSLMHCILRIGTGSCCCDFLLFQTAIISTRIQA